jgi:hypothetical protein
MLLCAVARVGTAICGCRATKSRRLARDVANGIPRFREPRFPELGYTLVVLSNYDNGANLAGAYISELLR